MRNYILIPDGEGAWWAFAMIGERNIPLAGRYHRIHSGAWVSDTVDHSIEPSEAILSPSEAS
jgi:hypothetical protein